MNPLALSALALASASSSPTTAPDEHDWSLLDHDIANLSASLTEDTQGLDVHGWIKAGYRSNGDKFDDLNGNGTQDPGEDDLAGFQFNSVRLVFKGKVGPWDLMYSAEAASNGNLGTLATKDAYGRTALCSQVHLQIGNFKSPFLFTAVSSDDKEIFYDRTTEGDLWTGRDLGLQLDGQHGPFGWYAAAENGGDGAGNQWMWVGKATFALVGAPIPMKQTGGFGVDADTQLQAGVGYATDANTIKGDADAVVGELTLISGPAFVHGDVIDYGSGFLADSDNNAGNGLDSNGLVSGNASKAAKANVADTTPWSLTIGLMLAAEDEIALRYEDLDDNNGSKNYWLGYNHYFVGHAAKLQADWIRRNNDVQDTDEFVLGLVLSI